MPTVIVETSPADRALRTGTEWYVRELVEAMGRAPPEGVTYVQMKKPSWWRFPLWTHLGFGPLILIKKPEVAFVPSHALPWTARWGRTRWVTTIHDLAFLTHPYLYARNERRYLKWALDQARRYADLIIVPTGHVRRGLVELGFSKERICVISHGLRAEYGTQAEDTIDRVIRQYQLKTPYFIHVGRLDRKKDIPLILEAHRAFVRSHPAVQVPIVFVGPIKNIELGRMIKNYRDSIGLGWCPEADLAGLIAGASALIFPGRYEGFGLPILEAMATGTPVITSSGGATEEVAGDAAYLVTPGSVQELAQAMHGLVTQPGLATELHKRGLERAREFTWQKSAQETWGEIMNLL